MVKRITMMALPFLVGCGELGPIACTADFRYGLSVEVLDAASSAPIADSATMTLRDGGYVETVTSSFGGSTLMGAGERAGNYTVSVARPRYHDWIATDVRVDADECHVIPVSLTANMVATTP